MPNPFPPLPSPEEGETPKWQSPDWFGTAGTPVNPPDEEPPAKPARPAPAPRAAEPKFPPAPVPRAAQPPPTPEPDHEVHEPRRPNLDPRTMPRMPGLEGFQSQVNDASLWPGQGDPPARNEEEPAAGIPPGFVEDPVFGIVPAPEASASARAGSRPELVPVGAMRETQREPQREPVEAPQFLQDQPIAPRVTNGGAAATHSHAEQWWRPFLAPWPLGVAGAIVVVVVLVFSISRKPGSGEPTVAISRIRAHAASYDGRAVRVHGRVGDVFQVGGGYAFYLLQGRDTMVVFTRSRVPQTDEKVVVNGVISTGMLNGQVRPALLEGAP